MTAEYVPRQAIERARTLAWITALGAITAEALSKRDDLSIAAARERLDEAVELGLMERHSLLVGYSDLYTVTSSGRTEARKHADAGGYSYPEGLRTARVTIKDARHTIACASAIAALERRYPDYRVMSERELHREEHAQQRRLGSVSVERYGQTRSHYPDIVLWPPPTPGEPPPLPVAVEVELTMKSKEELTAILRAFAGCYDIDAVVYYTDTLKLEERLLDTVEQLHAEEFIVVVPLSSIVESIPGFELAV
jgi:hypothetical protein